MQPEIEQGYCEKIGNGVMRGTYDMLLVSYRMFSKLKNRVILLV